MQITAQMFTAFYVIADAVGRVNHERPLRTLNLSDKADVKWLRNALNQAMLDQQYDTPLGTIEIDESGEITQHVFCVAELKFEEGIGIFERKLSSGNECN